ncbi:hypothetical protein BH10PSE17_BH10PSE17_18470 [soil metagenome]
MTSSPPHRSWPARALAAGLLCAAAPFVQAQTLAPQALQIPKSTDWSQATEWTGQVGAGVTLTRGNSDSTQAAFNFDLSRATIDDRILFHGIYTRNENDGITNTNNALLTGRYEHNLSPQWFSYGQADFERDPINDLSFRQTYGGGAGYRFIRTEETQFNIYTGLAYTIERNIIEEDNKGVQALIGNEWVWNMSPDSVFRQTFAYYPKMGNAGERSMFQAVVTSKLVGIVSLQVNFTAKYRAEVPDDNKHTDYSLITGLTAKF